MTTTATATLVDIARAPAALVRASNAQPLLDAAADADTRLILCASPDGARDRYRTAHYLIVDLDGARALGFGFTARRNFILVHRSQPQAAERAARIRGCDLLVDLDVPEHRAALAELLAQPYADPQPREEGPNRGSRFD